MNILPILNTTSSVETDREREPSFVVIDDAPLDVLETSEPFERGISESPSETLIQFAHSICADVTVETSLMGSLEFRLDDRTLAQLSGLTLDVALSRNLRDELLDAGVARPHPWLPSTGWVRIELSGDAGIEAGLDALYLAMRLALTHRSGSVKRAAFH